MITLVQLRVKLRQLENPQACCNCFLASRASPLVPSAVGTRRRRRVPMVMMMKMIEKRQERRNCS